MTLPESAGYSGDDLAIDDMGNPDSCRDICSGYRGLFGAEVLI